MNVEQLQILNEAINRNGADYQLDIAIEELAELQKEIIKHKRGFSNDTEIIDEMADVYIILKELEIIFLNDIAVNDRIAYKVSRLKERISKTKGGE